MDVYNNSFASTLVVLFIGGITNIVVGFCSYNLAYCSPRVNKGAHPIAIKQQINTNAIFFITTYRLIVLTMELQTDPTQGIARSLSLAT